MKQRKHPAGLPFLFFSEMWERLGYYLMIGIFTLYLGSRADDFNLASDEIDNLYGTYIGLVFLTPFIGGLIADRLLGYRLPIIIGGILMGIGYCLMSIPSLPALYGAMTLVILGNGLFKPNISTLLGNLYNEDKFKERKDEGFNLFYMGINIGAFISNFIAAILINVYGYYAAFIGAGVGMFIGVIIFLIGTRHYAHVDKPKVSQEGELPLWKILAVILIPAILFGVIGFFIPVTLVKDKITDAFLFACIPVIAFYVSLYMRAKKNEKRPIGAMLAIFAVVVAFWAVFKQNGSTLTKWADIYTDREIAKPIQPILSSIYLVDTIKYKIQEKESPKLDRHFRPILGNKDAFQYPKYFHNLPEKDKPKVGANIYAYNTNIFQSVNPFWVIVLTPLVIALFQFLRSKGREPSTPTKIAIGLLISGLSCLIMVAAVNASHNGAIKASYWWFFGTYGVVTIGELFLSPMGLSMVSKLSPPRLTSLMMGGWFLATSIGNKLSGVLSSFWDSYEDKRHFFYVNTGLLLFAALILFLMLRWLNKIFNEYKDGYQEEHLE